jgi:hypothetical protein
LQDVDVAVDDMGGRQGFVAMARQVRKVETFSELPCLSSDMLQHHKIACRVVRDSLKSQAPVAPHHELRGGL